MYNSLHLLTPSSRSILPLSPTPQQPQVCSLCLWLCFCFVDRFFVFLFVVVVLLLFRASPMAHGSSQARGWIQAIAAGIHYSHSNTRSKLWLTHTTAHSNAGSVTHWARPGIEPTTSWFLVRLFPQCQDRNLSLTLPLKHFAEWNPSESWGF